MKTDLTILFVILNNLLDKNNVCIMIKDKTIIQTNYPVLIVFPEFEELLKYFLETSAGLSF